MAVTGVHSHVGVASMLPALPAPFQKGTRVLMEMRTWGTAPPSLSSDAWQKSVVEPNVIGDSASSYDLPCLSVVMGLGMSGISFRA